jgi:nucleotide-binding universal stress UspA family protein
VLLIRFRRVRHTKFSRQFIGLAPPSAHAMEKKMYQHILIPTDGTELSKKAIDNGLALAKAVNARVTAVTVSRPYHAVVIEPDPIMDTPEEYEQRITSNAAKHLAVARDAARASGVNCDEVHVVREHVYQGIVDTAKNRGCDLIVMASRGRRTSSLLVASETANVLTHCTVPVLVHR